MQSSNTRWTGHPQHLKQSHHLHTPPPKTKWQPNVTRPHSILSLISHTNNLENNSRSLLRSPSHHHSTSTQSKYSANRNKKKYTNYNKENWAQLTQNIQVTINTRNFLPSSIPKHWHCSLFVLAPGSHYAMNQVYIRCLGFLLLPVSTILLSGDRKIRRSFAAFVAVDAIT